MNYGGKEKFLLMRILILLYFDLIFKEFMINNDLFKYIYMYIEERL